MINYSIIIPHYNSLDTLPRLLNSIPERKDIEIIIVDNSPRAILKEQIISTNHNFQLLYSDKTKGAGHARNIGLNYAIGKWLIFADADDYFVENFNKLLDQYVNYTEDIIYFKPRSVSYFINGTESNRVINYQNDFAKGADYLRYSYNTPWGKFIRRKHVMQFNYRFSEVGWSNDVYFMVRVGITANKVLAVDTFLYIVDERPGSLTSNKQFCKPEYICRITQDILSYKFALLVGYNATSDSLIWRSKMLIDKRQWRLLMRVYRSLPDNVKMQLRQIVLYKINLKGKLFFKLIFFLSNFSSKLI